MGMLMLVSKGLKEPENGNLEDLLVFLQDHPDLASQTIELFDGLVARNPKKVIQILFGTPILNFAPAF